LIQRIGRKLIKNPRVQWSWWRGDPKCINLGLDHTTRILWTHTITNQVLLVGFELPLVTALAEVRFGSQSLKVGWIVRPAQRSSLGMIDVSGPGVVTRTRRIPVRRDRSSPSTTWGWAVVWVTSYR